MDTHDTIFWILFSAVLILVSVFPRIADRLAQTLGIYSTENTVFLIIIFALLLRVFLLTIRSSQIEHRVRVLVEELAIREKEQQAKKKRWVKPEMTVCETRRKEADGTERGKTTEAKTGKSIRT